VSTENVTPTQLPGSEISGAGAAAQARVDPSLTLALAQASLAAYSAYEKTKVVPPDNYRLMASWTGWDGSIFGGSEELFGLLFQSTLPGAWKTFIFAFRGTDSDMDAYEDAFFDTTAFSPYKGSVSPTPWVSSGFYDIYDLIGGSMKQSMRQQLFALLAQHQPRRMYVTGHSLGGALSQLFTLDVAVSAPELWAANMNFASPMVGTADWKTAYESQPAQKDPARRSIRVFNYWDYAPSVPPSALNYTHVGAPFRTAFYVKDAWYPYLLARHSILNLQTVLRNAVWFDPQAWAGTFQDRSTDLNPPLMQSDFPPAGAEVAWADRMAEYMEFERSLRPPPPEPTGEEG
jgi:hypothetical protein